MRGWNRSFAVYRLRLANQSNLAAVGPGPGGGALPYVGGYQVPVNYRPPFLRQSYTE